MESRNVSERPRAVLAGVPVGGNLPVVVMGAVNVSPDSFYGGSVRVRADELVTLVSRMVDAGAAIVDVGARSTAPYRLTEVGEEEEAGRLSETVALLVREVPVPVSADTCRPGPARAAFDAGARVLNDVSGLRDPAVARLVAERGASCLLMALPDGAASERDPLATVRRLLRDALARALAAGIGEEQIVLDPGIGFFRDGAVPWPDWDVRILAGLLGLAGLGRPLAVGVSRKSFIGALTGHKAPEERLAGSLAATTAGVLAGADLVRTHDVGETVDAVRVAEALRQAASR
jgi:dihydropteroate synthase